MWTLSHHFRLQMKFWIIFLAVLSVIFNIKKSHWSFSWIKLLKKALVTSSDRHSNFILIGFKIFYICPIKNNFIKMEKKWKKMTVSYSQGDSKNGAQVKIFSNILQKYLHFFKAGLTRSCQNIFLSHGIISYYNLNTQEATNNLRLCWSSQFPSLKWLSSGQRGP